MLRTNLSEGAAFYVFKHSLPYFRQEPVKAKRKKDDIATVSSRFKLF